MALAAEAGLAGAIVLPIFEPEDLDTSGLNDTQCNRLALIVKMFAQKTLRYALDHPNGSKLKFGRGKVNRLSCSLANRAVPRCMLETSIKQMSEPAKLAKHNPDLRELQKLMDQMMDAESTLVRGETLVAISEKLKQCGFGDDCFRVSLIQLQDLAVARANEFVQNAAPPQKMSPERTAFTPIPAHLCTLVADNQENVRQGKGRLSPPEVIVAASCEVDREMAQNESLISRMPEKQFGKLSKKLETQERLSRRILEQQEEAEETADMRVDSTRKQIDFAQQENERLHAETHTYCSALGVHAQKGIQMLKEQHASNQQQMITNQQQMLQVQQMQQAQTEAWNPCFESILQELQQQQIVPARSAQPAQPRQPAPSSTTGPRPSAQSTGTPRSAAPPRSTGTPRQVPTPCSARAAPAASSAREREPTAQQKQIEQKTFEDCICLISVDPSKYDWQAVCAILDRLPQLVKDERDKNEARWASALKAIGPAVTNVLSDKRTQLLPSAINAVPSATQSNLHTTENLLDAPFHLLLPAPRQIVTIVEAAPESAPLLLRPNLLGGFLTASKTLRGKVQNHHSKSARAVVQYVEKWLLVASRNLACGGTPVLPIHLACLHCRPSKLSSGSRPSGRSKSSTLRSRQRRTSNHRRRALTPWSLSTPPLRSTSISSRR